MTDDKIEISDDVVARAADVFASFFQSSLRDATPGYLHKAASAAIKEAIKADRAGDARVLAERQACVEIVQKMPLRKLGDILDYLGAIRDTIAAIRARNGGDS